MGLSIIPIAILSAVLHKMVRRGGFCNDDQVDGCVINIYYYPMFS